MKHWIAAVAVTITVGSSSPTVITMPDEHYLDMVLIPRSCAEDGPVCSTATAVIPISTGPYVLKASTGDCYKLPYVNPNGTIPKTPMDWTACP